MESVSLPLFVDLDRTLVATDTLHEALVRWLARRPWRLVQVLRMGLRDRAGLKRRLETEGAMPDASTLPYRESVLKYLRAQSGRVMILATASDVAFARRVAAHVGLFDEVLGSDGDQNLKGKEKLRKIEESCTEHGWTGFGYMGDSKADLPIWQRAAHIVAVEPSRRVLRHLETFPAPVEVLRDESPPFARSLLKSLRPHHWAKNALLFVPVLLAQEWTNLSKLLDASNAFVAFCFAASSVYLTNDLIDLDADRRHHTKRLRPLAAGRISVKAAVFAAAVLFLAAILAAAMLSSTSFPLALAAYYALTVAYSVSLKRRLLVDVFVLAALYTIRLLSGGYATETSVSAWLLAFSVFVFMSLAFAKRYTELALLAAPRDDVRVVRRRAYVSTDLDIIRAVGPTSGYLAALVLALYINSEQVTSLYADPQTLWLLCPLLLYWITRIWFFAARGDLHDDPITFVIRDRITWITGATAVVILGLARLGLGVRFP